MKNLVLLAVLCASSLFAQEKKYQSLLWEVSGNGLSKKSYLYGSMHVSDKVSYHLSDAFFSHLLAADIVANESEPSTWAELFGIFGEDYNRYDNQFYTQFYQRPLTKEQLYPLFQTNNFTLNNLLFRTNERQKEYQEETYLDMFIYRTGKKYNKLTVGLEDTRRSILSIINADLTNARPKEENIPVIQKILKNNGYDEALMNFYRDKDLDMIDSLTSLSTSENYLKALLYDRNIVMVKSIDSLAKKGSLFAAVGAAHLPGKKGIIEMLRSKGYTVRPVFGSYTDAGKAKKQQIEDFFSRPAFKKYTTADGVLQLPLFTSVIENGNDVESPDLANGGYINIKRLLLKDYLKKDNKAFDHRSLDSLFYENIPGKIIEKKFFAQNGYDIYDIKNVTKTGKAQRYRYIISPLEIIMVSMSGEGNYSRRFEDEVFNNIILKPITAGWVKHSPKRGGFTVQLPAYTAVYGDKMNNVTVPDVEMHAYDSNEQANYFVLERTLQDNDNLLNSLTELKRIQFEFYNQFNVDSTQTKVEHNPLAFTSSSKIGAKIIRLKTILRAGKYYLLGTAGASDAGTNKFFESFEFTPVSTQTEFRTFEDSTANFAIRIPKMPNEKLVFAGRARDIEYVEEENPNLFKEDYKNYSFTLPSGQTVDLAYYKNHRYEAKKVIDTLIKDFRRTITRYSSDQPAKVQADSVSAYASRVNRDGTKPSVWSQRLGIKDENALSIINEKVIYNKENDYYQVDLLAIDKNSEQAIKYRAIFKNNQTYVLNTLVDKSYANSDPVTEELFNSVSLLDTKEQETQIKDKFELFLQDAQSDYDSIRRAALASLHEVKVNKDNVSELISFMEKYDFKSDQSSALITLYSKLGYVISPVVLGFLDKQYRKQNTTSVTQFAILDALTSQKTKDAYKKIIELLEYDLPIPDDKYEINSLFRSFGDDLEHSEELFPEILQFYSIEEYHQPIVDLTAKLLDNKNIKPNKLKSYKKMILTNAKLELKRVKSRQYANEDNPADYYDGETGADDLVSYLKLLYPFRNDKNVKQLFIDSRALATGNIDMELMRLDIANNSVTRESAELALKNPQTRFLAYHLLHSGKNNSSTQNVSDRDIAESGIYYFENVSENDIVEFVEKKDIAYGGRDISFFFFRVKDGKAKEYRARPDNLTAMGFVNDGSKIDPFAYRYVESKNIPEEDELPQLMKAMIDEALNENSLRSSFGKAEGYNGMETEEYGY